MSRVSVTYVFGGKLVTIVLIPALASFDHVNNLNSKFIIVNRIGFAIR